MSGPLSVSSTDWFTVGWGSHTTLVYSESLHFEFLWRGMRVELIKLINRSLTLEAYSGKTKQMLAVEGTLYPALKTVSQRHWKLWEVHSRISDKYSFPKSTVTGQKHYRQNNTRA